MARAMPSAAEVAQRWQSGFANAGTKWEAGVNAVDIAPGISAAAAKDRYLAGVNNSVDRYAANVARVTLPEWKAAAVSKGKGRLASGAAAGAPKYQSKIGPVLAAIGQIRDSLPPRGDINTNLQRANAMAMGLHERARQGF